MSCSFKLCTCVHRSWILGGGRYQNTYAIKGCYNGPDAHSCGSGTKKRESLQWSSFLWWMSHDPKGLLLFGETGSPIPYQNFYSTSKHVHKPDGFHAAFWFLNWELYCKNLPKVIIKCCIMLFRKQCSILE